MILAHNAVAAERLGCEPSEMLGRCIFDSLPPDVAARRKEVGEQVIRTGKMVRLEDERQGKWFDSSVYPIFNKEGRVSQWVIFSNDITERKRAEDALKETSEIFQLTARKFENIFLNSPAFHSLSTLDKGILLEVNPAFEALTGYSREEMIGKSAFDLRIWADPNERKRVIELLRKDGVVSGRR